MLHHTYLVAQSKLFLAKLHTPSEALRDAVTGLIEFACELKAHTIQC